MKTLILSAGLGLALATLPGTTAQAQDGPYAGDMIIMATNFCPQGWVRASGGRVDAEAHPNLNAAVGDTFGRIRNGRARLPDLRGRIPVHHGTGRGLAPVTFAEKTGSRDGLELAEANLPTHSHRAYATTEGPDQTSPEGGMLATFGSNAVAYADVAPNDPNMMAMESDIVSQTGSSAPINVDSPAVALNFCIAADAPPRP